MTSKSESGLTLIEVSVVLILFGLLILPVLSIWGVYRSQEIKQRTENRIQAIQTALENYAIRTGRYPRPAIRNIGVDNMAFGQELPEGVLPDIPECTGNEGRVCYIEGSRPGGRVPGDPLVFPGTMHRGSLLVGALPIAELGLPLSYYTDGWGGQFVYVVTEAQTDADNFDVPGLGYIRFLFDVMGGMIQIADNGDQGGTVGPGDDIPGNLIDGTYIADNTSDNGVRGTVHWFVFSAGKNGAGTYSDNGVLIQPCGNLETGRDSINCDLADYVFTNNAGWSGVGGAAIFRTSQSLMPGPAYYDDFTSKPIVTTTNEPWARGIANDENSDLFTTTFSNVIVSDTRNALSVPAFGKLNVHGNFRIDRTDTNGDGDVDLADDPPTLQAFRLCGPKIDSGPEIQLTAADAVTYGYSTSNELDPRFVMVDTADGDKLYWPQRDPGGNLIKDAGDNPLIDPLRPVFEDDECLPSQLIENALIGDPFYGANIFSTSLVEGDPFEPGAEDGDESKKGIHCVKGSKRDAIHGITNNNEECEGIKGPDLNLPCDGPGEYAQKIENGQFYCYGRDL